jgi:hypothetical protein
MYITLEENFVMNVLFSYNLMITSKVYEIQTLTPINNTIFLSTKLKEITL